METHSYYCTQRPPVPGSVPKNGLRSTFASERIIRGREVYAVVEYDRKLTTKEISDYELTPVQKCETCEYHDEFTGACCNGDSEHCADFTSNEDSCQDWEYKALEGDE